MGFNCGTLNPRSTKNPSPTTALRRRLRHRARRNHRRITPCHARSPALCATTPPQATAFAARIASSRPSEPLPLRACAGPEPGSSMPHGTRRACRARRMRDANGNAAQTGGLARQVRQRMNRLGKPEHRARFCFFSKKKSLAGTRRFPTTPEIQIPMGFNRRPQSPQPQKPFSNHRP